MSHNIPKKIFVSSLSSSAANLVMSEDWQLSRSAARPPHSEFLVKLLLPRYYRIQPLIGLAPTRHRDWDIYAAVSTQENIYIEYTLQYLHITHDIYRRRSCVDLLSADTQPGLRGCEDTRLCIHA